LKSRIWIVVVAVALGLFFAYGYYKDQSEKRISILLENKEKRILTLVYQESKWDIPYQEIGLKYNTNKQNKQGSFSYNKEKLMEKIKEINKVISKSSKDAIMTIDPKGLIHVTPDAKGAKIDQLQLIKKIEESFNADKALLIEVPIKLIMPRYQEQHLRLISSEIGRGQTAYRQDEYNRVSNIKNAIKKINGSILLPEEEFSLNEVIGRRTLENGYKNAPVIVDGKLVPGMGGGVCQVATTLYKAVLKAQLEVMERTHHSFSPTYVEIGQDATIAGEHIDFKFKNNRKVPIYLLCTAGKGRILISIYSDKMPANQKVRIESQILEEESPQPERIIRDSNLKEGDMKIEKEEKIGYKVAVYRNIYDGEKLLIRELITKDYYRPIRGIVRIGTAQEMPSSGIAPGSMNGNAEGNIGGLIEEPDNPPAQ
jgi:vancomycin resistance protein YoaR